MTAKKRELSSPPSEPIWWRVKPKGAETESHCFQRTAFAACAEVGIGLGEAEICEPLYEKDAFHRGNGSSNGVPT